MKGKVGRFKGKEADDMKVIEDLERKKGMK